MSKNNYSASQQSNSSESTLGSVPFTVYELANTGTELQSLSLKLTDECSTAIRKAIKSKRNIRMHVQKQGTVIEVDSGENKKMLFKCALHNQTETDSICFDPVLNIYKNVGPAMKSRLQVQATDKSFAEMKEKTQKLVEAEQMKKAKDMSKSQKKGKFSSQETHRKSPSSSFLSKFAPKRTHIPSPTQFAPKRTHSPSPTPNIRKTFNVPPSSKQLRPIEVKQEIVKASTNMEERKTTVKEELRNVKFQTEEKKSSRDEVRASPKPFKTASQTNELKSSSAVPVDVLPSYFGSKGHLKESGVTSPKKDLFYMPKQKLMPNHAPSISPASTATSTPKTISPPFPVRPASVDSALQHSSSCSPEDSLEQGSMTVPAKPSRDWSQEFGLIGSQDEARRYHSIFRNEYPEYRKYFDELTRIAEDFCTLKLSLENANDEMEREKVEKIIRKKFSDLQNDQQFLFKRQRHCDLRAKLEVLKKALEKWNETVQ